MNVNDRRFEHKVNPNLCGAGQCLDMEEEIDNIAADIALEEYKQEFTELPRQARNWCFEKAIQEWHDRQAAKAERLEDR